jgi:Flp pilus assembly protein protease CpaA
MLFIIVALIALAVASYTDFRTREVPDYLNYGLIFFGFGARLMFSIAYADWTYIIEGIVGFIVCLIVALIMFYMGQWGGGDAKMLMGLGATVGLTINLNTLLLRFLVNIVLIGALYGLVYSIILAAANWKPFLKGVKKILRQKSIRIVRRIVYALMLVLLLAVLFVHDSLLKLLLLVLLFMIPLTMYVWLFVKVIEKVVMLKYVTPDKITEGDWIAKPVWVENYENISPFEYLKEKYREYYKMNIFMKATNYLKFKYFNTEKKSFKQYMKNINKNRLEGKILSMFIGLKFNDKKAIKEILSINEIKPINKITNKIMDKKIIKKIIKKLKNEGYTFNRIRMCGPKDLGIEKKQIKKLIELYKQGKIKKVLVKYGIPFVPSFLIAFVVSLAGFNPILLFL